MAAPICDECKKNIAVVFVTAVENGKTTQRGYCMKCARKHNFQQLDDIIKSMGLSEDDIDMLNDGMRDAFADGGMFRQLMEGNPDSDQDEGSESEPPEISSFIKKLEEEDSADDEDYNDEDGPIFPFMKNMLARSAPDGRAAPNEKPGKDTKKEQSEKKQKEKRDKFLEMYCVSLTRRARNNEIDNIIGRETETERLIQILNRRTKNNPCLIGEPGVGKTAIAEGLALRISSNEVPLKLRGKELLSVDMTALVAGTQFRGQFEQRMKNLIEHVKAAGNILLFIDEIHTIIGAGDAEGSMNAANILKPALSRGEIQVIGATTFNEYRKNIERDAALERRFQPISVSEPSISDAIEIIKGVTRYYEDYHAVKISDDVARQAVLMSERYITDRYLPDKAIDLIDEAASRLNLKTSSIARTGQVKKDIADLGLEREYLLSLEPTDEIHHRLADIRSSEIRLNDELSLLLQKEKPVLSTEDLAYVIEQWTKIPASAIREDEFEKLSKLDLRLKSRLIGQDAAIDAVCSAIRRNRVGISSKRKPVSFIFVGSTGVGKTELVKQLSEDLFNSPESLIRIDMSEYMEKHSASRLVGSPPGYVGYDEAGQLTEKIRRRPYSVILFDEIEKAHPDVLNMLLQILDDGRLTDAHGRTVNFENTVIIMTTNAGSEIKGTSLGFGMTAGELDKTKAEKSLKEFLRPEFINRVDEIVYFNKLSEQDFIHIADIMMHELQDSMAEKNYTLIYDTSLLQYLAKKAYSLTYGARNLRRLIQKEVEGNVTEVIVTNYAAPIRDLRLKVSDEKIEVSPEE
ncbi:MAG: ATP-dependent Clp protease ATP-binding subunit [Oscillospiraceae bacterium]|jgi:ATP-dependent Clp protease ATP-binding subunit ClpA|nr:ATP-dependent Clp protease ATP-binding subunit [Oscillospiraceae bacterium]